MKVLYDDCIEALKNNKCSECTNFYQCSVCDYVQQQYAKGRAEAKKEIKEIMDKDVPISNIIYELDKWLKEQKNG